MGFLELARRKVKEMELERTSKILDPIEALDEFWSQDIIPRLSRLQRDGQLHDLSTCPLWEEVDGLWQEPRPDVKKVKSAMAKALGIYERPHTKKQQSNGGTK